MSKKNEKYVLVPYNKECDRGCKEVVQKGFAGTSC